jgi:hypothetical protein
MEIMTKILPGLQDVGDARPSAISRDHPSSSTIPEPIASWLAIKQRANFGSGTEGRRKPMRPAKIIPET